MTFTAVCLLLVLWPTATLKPGWIVIAAAVLFALGYWLWWELDNNHPSV